MTSITITITWKDDISLRLDLSVMLRSHILIDQTVNNLFCTITQTGEREGPKPGNYLLPAFGFCSLQEASQDIKFLITNKHKLVCEMSQYILYQYVFFLFWICMVFGIVVSAVGFILTVSNYSITFFTLMNSGTKARYKCDLLSSIYRKSFLSLHHKLINENHGLHSEELVQQKPYYCIHNIQRYSMY